MQHCRAFFVFILTTAISVASFAYSPKEGNVTATLGPYFYTTRFAGSPTGAKSPIFGDIGLIVNGDVSEKGALEIAMFHMQKLYVREQGGNYIGEETELMHITMGYRRWLNSFFSVSAALFSSYAMGDPRIVHNDFPAGTEIDTSARDITEYGFDISLQTEIWNRDELAVVLDTRYSLSATSKPNERGNHYGILIGLKYFVQEKQSRGPAPK